MRVRVVDSTIPYNDYFTMFSDQCASFEITITNFATCCRLCFSQQTKSKIYNNYLESAHTVSVVEAIESIANIKITSNEKLSNNICMLCLARLNDAYCFIRDIRTNNETMQSFYEDEDDPQAEEPFLEDVLDNDDDNDGSTSPMAQVNAVDLVLNDIASHAKRRTEAKRDGANVRVRHQCTLCEKTFLRKSNLIDHQRLHDQVKLFKCDYCSKSFVQSGNLRTHLRTHTAEKPYHCTICGKSFNQSGTLKVHMRAHADIKPHFCDTCEKSFVSNSDLVKHKLSHSKRKGFQCVICPNRFFTQKIHLKRHLESMHKLKDIQRLLSEGILNKPL